MAAKRATSYKPEGFHTVTPYLVVQNVARLFEFLNKAFAAEVIYRGTRPDGTIGHAQVRIGDSMVEMGEASEQWKAMKVAIHVYVPDADAVYKRAIEAGGTSLHEPADMFYGERSGGVQDPSGNMWFIATHTEDLTEEELQQRMAAKR